jgi:hypothetical protein
MENRKRAPASPCARSKSRPASPFHFLFSIFIFGFLLSGCASPGDPTERKTPVPATITDLAAAQSGNDVILTFTPPKETAQHKPLKENPTIEIYRDFEPAAGAAGAASPHAPVNPSLLVTIPPGMADQYTEKGQIRYADALTAGDFAQHPDGVAVYIVRARASAKKESADSNAADVRIYPALDPIGDLKAGIAHSTVELEWTAPQKMVTGTAPLVAGYRIYRAEAEPGPAAGPVSEPGAASLDLKPRLAKIGDTESTTFEDTQAELGRTYTYSVRSIAQYPGEALESADSNLAVVTVRDIIPPSAPAGLIAVCAPAQGGTPGYADLSWAISPETNIAGYNVYRSREAGVPGTRLNVTLLLSPAFRDINIEPGQHYYRVTASDRSGNESPASVAVSCDVPGESQPTP